VQSGRHQGASGDGGCSASFDLGGAVAGPNDRLDRGYLPGEPLGSVSEPGVGAPERRILAWGEIAARYLGQQGKARIRVADLEIHFERVTALKCGGVTTVGGEVAAAPPATKANALVAEPDVCRELVAVLCADVTVQRASCEAEFILEVERGIARGADDLETDIPVRVRQVAEERVLVGCLEATDPQAALDGEDSLRAGPLDQPERPVRLSSKDLEG